MWIPVNISGLKGAWNFTAPCLDRHRVCWEGSLKEILGDFLLWLLSTVSQVGTLRMVCSYWLRRQIHSFIFASCKCLDCAEGKWRAGEILSGLQVVHLAIPRSQHGHVAETQPPRTETAPQIVLEVPSDRAPEQLVTVPWGTPGSHLASDLWPFCSAVPGFCETALQTSGLPMYSCLTASILLHFLNLQ